MILYAESSAVLAWLWGESAGAAVRSALEEASLVLASDLTLLECARAFTRAAAAGSVPEGKAADARAQLARAAEHWVRLAVDDTVVERAGRPFPAEPIRTLDAVHLATALVARAAVPGGAVLSLDERVRRSAAALGFALLPEST